MTHHLIVAFAAAPDDGTVSTVFTLVFVAIWLGFVIYVSHYWVRRWLSFRWPKLEATIDRGVVRRMSFGRRMRGDVSYFRYSYPVEGQTYFGTFAVYGEGAVEARDLCQPLINTTITIRYKPSQPAISVLEDLNDLRFRGCTASQDFSWLDKGSALEFTQ